MLKNVLKEIFNSKVYSAAFIGRQLGISGGMVEDIVAQLIRMGYLIEDLGSPTCETKCFGCNISNCNATPIKMLSVTEKGKILINS